MKRTATDANADAAEAAAAAATGKDAKSPTIPPYERIMTASAVDVAATFARELSVDPTVQTSICAEWSTRRPEMKSGSQQDALVAQLLGLLTENIQLEVVATPIGKDDQTFHLYIFGTERPMFCFSLACLSTNPTLSACIVRMIGSGWERGGVGAERFFRRRYMPPDKSRLEYKEFAFNDLFACHFFRAALLLHFVMVFMSGIDIYFADIYPDVEVALRGAVLLDRVIADLDSRLAQTLHVGGGARMPWLSPATSRVVNLLRTTEKTPQGVKKLFSVAIAEHIKTYAAVKH